MLKVLIADDEKMPRDILSNYINWSNLGVTGILEADDGLKALNIAMEEKPDIIISDIKMPHMNGIDFATKIREHLPDTKLIFLSGYSDKEYLKSAIKLKAVSYIEKPIDLEEITSLLKDTISDLVEEQNKKSEAHVLIENRLCISLTLQSVDSEDVLEKCKSLNKSFCNYNKYVTSIINFNESSYKEINFSSLKSIIELRDDLYILGVKGEDCAIIHFALNDENTIIKVKEVLAKLISTVKSTINNNCTIFASLGKEEASFCELYKSYQTAVMAMQKHFYRGRNIVIAFEDDNSPPLEFDENILTSLDSCIKNNRQTEAEVLVKRLVLSFKNHENTHHNLVRNTFYKMILSLARIAQDRNIPFLKDQSNHILHTITNSKTIDEIEKSVLTLILSIFEYLNTSFDPGKDTIVKITNYITSNFCDENITVNSIAEQLNLTPTYLCMVFKRDTGKTINQYITNLRVEKAKEFLAIREIKLYDVARRVGYNDGKYFTRVFTKTTGLNPKEYREIHSRDKKNN